MKEIYEYEKYIEVKAEVNLEVELMVDLKEINKLTKENKELEEKNQDLDHTKEQVFLLRLQVE